MEKIWRDCSILLFTFIRFCPPVTSPVLYLTLLTEHRTADTIYRELDIRTDDSLSVLRIVGGTTMIHDTIVAFLVTVVVLVVLYTCLNWLLSVREF